MLQKCFTLKHLQKCLRAVNFPPLCHGPKMFYYFTCNSTSETFMQVANVLQMFNFIFYFTRYYGLSVGMGKIDKVLRKYHSLK